MTEEIELARAVSIYLALSANVARLSYQLVLTEGHLGKVFSVRVANDTRSHTDKAQSGVLSHKQTRCQPRL